MISSRIALARRQRAHGSGALGDEMTSGALPTTQRKSVDVGLSTVAVPSRKIIHPKWPALSILTVVAMILPTIVSY